jgi:hypothetical protein
MAHALRKHRLGPALGGRAHLRHPGRPALLALLLAMALAAAMTGLGGREPGPVLPRDHVASDCSGPVRDWLLATPGVHAEVFLPTQADLLAWADPAIRFHVVYSDPAVRDALARRVTALQSGGLARVTWSRVPRSVSPWVRDYFVPGRAADGAPLAWLHHPDHYRGATGAWDSVDPHDFTGALPGLRTVPTRMRLEGGEVVADDERVFANRAPVEAALAHGEAPTAQAFESAAEALWGRPVTWLDTDGAAPNDHCDLLLMPVGGRRVVLGSPRLGATLLASATPDELARFARRVARLAALVPATGEALERLHGDVLGPLRTQSLAPARLRAADRVRAEVEAAGYGCMEVPFLALGAPDSALTLTISYTNVVQDERDGRRTVYMPAYGLACLDRAAAATWARLGYRVVWIDALGPGLLGGSVRCLGQVVR